RSRHRRSYPDARRRRDVDAVGAVARRFAARVRVEYCRPTMTLAHDLQYAAELARGAGKIVLDHYGKVERLTKTHVAASAEAVTDADRGQGAWLGSKRLSVLTTPLSESSMIMFTSNLLTRGRCPDWAHRFLAQEHWKLRILGSAALEATYVAAGVAHAAVTVNGKLWDVAASAALVLEAGGVMTDFAGRSIFPFDLADYAGAKVPFLAAGPAAHKPLL